MSNQLSHTHTHTHTHTIKRANRFQMEWQSVLLEIINDLLRKSVYSVCRMRPVRIMMVRKHCWSMAHNLHSTTAVIINNTNTNQFKSTIFQHFQRKIQQQQQQQQKNPGIVRRGEGAESRAVRRPAARWRWHRPPPHNSSS